MRSYTGRVGFLTDCINSVPLHLWVYRYAASTARTQCLSAFKSKEVLEAYKNLGLSPDEEVGPIEVREAFFDLAKRYHPDTGSSEADSQKFATARDAYRIVMESGTVEGVGTPNIKPDDGNVTAADEVMAEFARRFDIRHTAPQHRQYLSFDGYGRGSPMQRSRQFDKHRAESAAVKAVEYRVEKIAWKDEKHSLVVDKKRTKDVKTRLGMERVVEDLIQESMQKGEFDVIKGKGKPLKPGTENPYTDFMTTKINEILINNGYQPEWVEIGKEIRQCSQAARERLSLARQSLGEFPFESEEEEKLWLSHVAIFRQEWKSVGDKIIKFNLVVPTLNQQIVPISVEKEIEKILRGESEPILSMSAINSNSSSDLNQNGLTPKNYGRSSSVEHGTINSSNFDPNFESPMELLRSMIRNMFFWKRPK